MTAAGGRLRLLLAAAALLVTVTACGGTKPTQQNSGGAVTQRTHSVQELDTGFVQAQNQFGLELHSQLAAEKPGGNVFVSPYSVAAALSMIYHGAGGQTYQEMSGLLHNPKLTSDEWNRNSLVLRDLLEHAGEEQELSVGNSVWLRQGFEVKPDYLERTRQAFGAEVSEVDFNRPDKAAKTINSWVKKKTRDRIDKIVDAATIAKSRVVLVNTVYFNSQWQRPFPAEDTSSADFHSESGQKSREVQMMRVSDSFPYEETVRYQAVQLPYIGERMDMLVMVPKAGVTLAQLQEELGADTDFWQRKRGSRQGVVEIPKFQMETKYKLNEALQALGMKEAFDERADFSGITDNGIMVDQVNHRTFVRVDEKGTEAAAATAVVMKESAEMSTQEPFQLRADRPFLAAIRSTETGALLFLGSVYEPEAVE